MGTASKTGKSELSLAAVPRTLGSWRLPPPSISLKYEDIGRISPSREFLESPAEEDCGFSVMVEVPIVFWNDRHNNTKIGQIYIDYC